MIIDAIEAWANACVGIVVSWAATFWLLPPLFGLAPNVAQATGMTALFFFLSFARAWVLRALFRRLDRG